jgi:hydrogenase large subunit
MPAIKSGEHLGVGLWGASRGFLAHWARLDDGKIDNYQISIPSRVNASTRTPWGDLGPCEQAVLNTPILESNFTGEHDFKGIDIQRAIQSFDPCMSCTTHIHLPKTGTVLDSIVDTGFPV